MNRMRRTYAMDVRAKKPDGSGFTGYCAVFHSIDEYGTIMAKGCFDKHIGKFRSEGFIGGLNHDWDQPVGSVVDASVDEFGLIVEGTVLDTTHGLDLRKLLAAGVVKKLSFGFDVLGRTYLEEESDVKEYWASVGYQPTETDRAWAAHGALAFTDVRVYEASPVMMPGNERAEITSVREGAGAGQSACSLEDHCATVRDAVAVLCERVEAVAALRRADARSLPPERRAALRQIHDRLGSALAACQPRANPDEVAKLRRDLVDLDVSFLRSQLGGLSCR